MLCFLMLLGIAIFELKVNIQFHFFDELLSIN